MNNNVLIFGASSGIGYHAAELLKKESNIIYNASRTCSPDTDIYNIKCDVTVEGDIEKAVNGIIESKNDINTMIYMAGYSMAAPIEYVKEEDYRYLFEVNYFGALKSIKAVVPHMRKIGGGRIVLASSIGAVLPIAFDSFYSSSKAALDMLAREANIELNKYNIFITSVQIGGTCSRFTFKRNVYPEQDVGCYGESLNKAAVALAGIEQSGMTPQESAKTIYNVLSAEKPPAVVSAGWKNKIYSVSAKLLPLKVSDFINKNQYLQ